MMYDDDQWGEIDSLENEIKNLNDELRRLENEMKKLDEDDESLPWYEDEALSLKKEISEATEELKWLRKGR